MTRPAVPGDLFPHSPRRVIPSMAGIRMSVRRTSYGPPFSSMVQRLVPVGRLFHGVSRDFEALPDDGTEEFLVIDHEDAHL